MVTRLLEYKNLSKTKPISGFSAVPEQRSIRNLNRYNYSCSTPCDEKEVTLKKPQRRTTSEVFEQGT